MNWREKASEIIPEMNIHLTQSGNAMSFWIEVWIAFEEAYQFPKNEHLIHRIYHFANWCAAQEQPANIDAGNHLLTCVVVSFYEHIPSCAAARSDIPLWFKKKR